MKMTAEHYVVLHDAFAGIVDRIRDLNHLESAMVDAGQTLVAPIG